MSGCYRGCFHLVSCAFQFWLFTSPNLLGSNREALDVFVFLRRQSRKAVSKQLKDASSTFSVCQNKPIVWQTALVQEQRHQMHQRQPCLSAGQPRTKKCPGLYDEVCLIMCWYAHADHQVTGCITSDSTQRGDLLKLEDASRMFEPAVAEASEPPATGPHADGSVQV